MKFAMMRGAACLFCFEASASAFCPITLASPGTLIVSTCIQNRSCSSVRMSVAPFDKLSKFSKSSLLNIRGGVIRNDKPKTWLVGQFQAVLKALRSESRNACHSAEVAFSISDLGFILCFALLPEAICRFINNRIFNKTLRKTNPLVFEDTPYLAPISHALCQIGQLSLLVYFGELFMVFLSGLGVPAEPKLLGMLVYCLYAIHVLRKLKDRVLNKVFERLPVSPQINSSARKLLYSRTLDASIYLIGALLLMDANNIDVGVAVQSLLTVGGVSSVVIGYALTEPVTEVIQGTSVMLSNKFIPGDTIRLSDGTCGKVQVLGWTDVTMQGDDNSFVRIPHSQMAKTLIVNLSRMPCSQVTQEISLPNQGSDKIQALLENVKVQIRAACPELDESQPFLVHWTSFEKPDNVVITVETHFRIPRLSEEYWINRQNVLAAINGAIEKYNT